LQKRKEGFDKMNQIKCENCQEVFKDFEDFKNHFTEDNQAECNILLEELRILEE
jgi:hypothetical protein